MSFSGSNSAAEQQPGTSAACRHVGQPPRFLGVGIGGLVVQLPVAGDVERTGPGAGEPQADPGCRGLLRAALGIEGQPQGGRLAAAGELAAEIGDGDAVELQALCRVHGHHPDPGVILGRHRRLGLAIGERGPRGGLIEEAAQVPALVRLVLAGDPDQLEQVGGAAQPVVHQQGGEVVAEPLEDAFDQLVERQQGGRGAEAGERVVEVAEQLAVGVREALRPAPLLGPALDQLRIDLIGRFLRGIAGFGGVWDRCGRRPRPHRRGR